MRLLWVKAGKLLPVDTGGKIRSYNLLTHLTRWHDVTLLSYYPGPPDAAYHQDLKQVFPGAIAVPARLPAKVSVRGRFDFMKGLLSELPYTVHKHTTREVRERVRKLLASGSFDLAVCDFLAPSANFGLKAPIPVILFEHNVETILWERQAANQTNAVTALVYKLEASKMGRYETTAIRRFDHVIAVSENDGDWFRAHCGSSKVSVVPTGVDTRMYTRDGDSASDSSLIMFVGSMDWQANVDGVLHFCREILPIVRTRLPGARFRIVGRNPGPAIRNLAAEGIEVTGTVHSVVPHLCEAGVVVVPLRIGGGTRLKILEAMAMGKAIVSTTIGAEGLDVADGSEIVLADTPADFASALLRLMLDDRERSWLGRNATLKAQQSGWDRAAAAFDKALVKALGGETTPSAHSIDAAVGCHSSNEEGAGTARTSTSSAILSGGRQR